jgi:hypothetical protein
MLELGSVGCVLKFHQYQTSSVRWDIDCRQAITNASVVLVLLFKRLIMQLIHKLMKVSGY